MNQQTALVCLPNLHVNIIAPYQFLESPANQPDDVVRLLATPSLRTVSDATLVKRSSHLTCQTNFIPRCFLLPQGAGGQKNCLFITYGYSGSLLVLTLQSIECFHSHKPAQ